MNETIEYILTFLLGDQAFPEAFYKVGYTNNPEEFSRYKLVIRKSDFFDDDVYGTVKSLPTLPLQIWDDTPILFGEASTEQIGDTLIFNADLIASTYFLISRYEEMVRRDVRDSHGRFPGKESLPYRAGFIDSPLVDEYRKILLLKLRDLGVSVDECPKKIRKVYLTHDVDRISHYRTIRSLMAGLFRGLKRQNEGNMALRSYFGGLKLDPWYTFPWLFKQNKAVQDKMGDDRCQTIVFVRSNGRKYKEDKPYVNLLQPDYKNFIKYCKRKKIHIGLHASYEAGVKPELIASEKKKLERLAHIKTTYNRHHFLNCREPEDLQKLIDAGFTDDFSIGYADIAGFRLGTCRAVKWINPLTKSLTDLTLHPLTIMDVSLSEKRYMYFNAHDAFEYCVQLINLVENYNGDLILLWHNDSVEKSPSKYHRKLYKNIISFLKTK